jgi:DNA-binding YbaB/EbfC family protein
MRLPIGGGGMAEQLRRLQEDMANTQAALGEETVEVTAGGGVIKVVMTGHQRVQALTIDPEVVNPEDVEMLQDLVVVAVNEAIEKSQSLAAERMSGLTAGLGIPGLF